MLIASEDVAGCPQFHRVIGEDPVGGFQVSACPVGKPQERGCLFAPEMVCLGREVERPLSIRHGAGHIAESLSMIGAGDGYCRRQRPKLLFVHDDHLGRWVFRLSIHVICRFQPSFGVLQSGLGGLHLAATQ